MLNILIFCTYKYVIIFHAQLKRARNFFYLLGAGFDRHGTIVIAEFKRATNGLLIR